jgi:hypothetical protein
MKTKTHKIKIVELIEILNKCFDKVIDPRGPMVQIPLRDFLMSSFAVFNLKFPSLLSFENSYKNGSSPNIKSLFGVGQVPSDTHFRDVIDLIAPIGLRRVFTSFFANFQRNKHLEKFEFIHLDGDGYYLVATDGTGYFSSEEVHCDNCLTYNEENEDKKTRFGHYVLAASLVHPEQKEVISFCPEPIMIQDGSNKNDCEQNAFRRFVGDFRREHPKLNAIMILDALYTNAPMIKLLNENKLKFIMNVKETKHSLFIRYKSAKDKGEVETLVETTQIGEKIIKRITKYYDYINNINLSQSEVSPLVNFILMREVIEWSDKNKEEKREETKFSWVTDIIVTRDNVKQLAQGGRCRWKIENETINTLKNQGYYLEHNYGHGKQNLSINLITMMFAAFLADQIQQACCGKFKKALLVKGRKKYFWQHYLSLYQLVQIPDWDSYFDLIAGNKKLVFNTT